MTSGFNLGSGDFARAHAESRKLGAPFSMLQEIKENQTVVCPKLNKAILDPARRFCALMEFRCTVELREPSALSHGFHGICLNISIKFKALRYPHLLNNGIGGGGDPEISFVVWGPPHPLMVGGILRSRPL